MWESLSSPVVVFWGAIVLITCVPMLAYYWREMRKDELESSLKHEMIARGMSADEIERVLSAGMGESASERPSSARQATEL